MARESVKILQGKLDVESLIAQLNAALAEEWLAYYQYWVGALVVEGAMRADVQGEFEEHAEEERRHAQLLADRIIELEGVPVLDPKQWFELARCKYDTPQGFDSVSLLNAAQSFVIRKLQILPMGKISLPATSPNIFLPKRKNMNRICRII